MPQQNSLESIISLMQLGAYSDVIQTSQALLRTDPNNRVAQNLLGTALAETGEIERSIDVLQDLVQKFPDYAFAYHNLGNILVKSGDPCAALPFLHKAVEQAPSQAEIHSSLANALENSGDLNGAIKTSRIAVSLAPDIAQHRKRLASYLRQLGMLAEALEELDTVLVSEPSDHEMLIATGEILGQLKRNEEALKRFHKAATIKPDTPEVYIGVGRLWLRGNQLQKSIEAFQEAAALAPDDADIQKLLADAHTRAGEIDHAIIAYETCLKIDPKDAHAQHFIAALAQNTTATAPPEYIRSLFDHYAKTFEQSLVGDLEYRTPDIIWDRLNSVLPSGIRFSSVLDLGCGTGLMGEKIRDKADFISGVDLSENMIKIARAKSIYDQLRVGDLTETIRADQDRHDLYIAADVLIYIGDLTELFSAISEVASRGAIFAFTTEHLVGEGFKLLTSGRYSHSSKYIEANIKKSNMSIIDSGLVDLRREHGEMLRGACYIVKVPTV